MTGGVGMVLSSPGKGKLPVGLKRTDANEGHGTIVRHFAGPLSVDAGPRDLVPHNPGLWANLKLGSLSLPLLESGTSGKEGP